jgi:hypothetical protein
MRGRCTRNSSHAAPGFAVPRPNYEWAFEMQAEDLDGNVLRLGSDPKPGVPYGEFLDAAGVRWPMA